MSNIWDSAHMEAASAQLHDSKNWGAFRRSALKSFSAMSFPDFKYGIDIRADLSRLDWNSFVFDSEKSKRFETPLGNGAFMCDFSTAFEKYPQIIDSNLGQQLRVSEKMEALHAAFLSRGTLIYVPAHVNLSALVSHVVELGKYSQVDHLLVVVEENASAVILQRVHSQLASYDRPIFHSSVVEIVAKANSNVSFGRVQDLPVQNVYHFSIQRAQEMESAHVGMEWAEFGAQFAQSEYSSFLNGVNSNSTNLGIVLGSHEQHLDVHQAAHHVAAHTASVLSARGALDQQSKCVYRGLIRMEKEAARANGKQSCDLLLLSPGAEADPVPSLEILNSDVKCAHSATVGRIDKEKLFYLGSRGVSEEQARNMVISGYFEDILSRFSIRELKAQCESVLEQRLGLKSNTFEELEQSLPNEVRV